MSPSELERLEALCRAATPAPWSAKCDYVYDEKSEFVCNAGTTDDAEFIAAARVAVPMLVARVRALENPIGVSEPQSPAYCKRCTWVDRWVSTSGERCRICGELLGGGE